LVIISLTVDLKIDANLDAQYRTAVAGECESLFYALFSTMISNDPFPVLIRPIHHNDVPS